MDIEILNDSQAFTRIIEPYISNLIVLGVNAKHTKIDNAQMTERERSFDFDIIVGNFPMSFTPSSGLKQYFGSETADISIFNKAGIKSEAIDKLIEIVMDLVRRPEARFNTGPEYLSQKISSWQDIDYTSKRTTKVVSNCVLNLIGLPNLPTTNS